MSDNEEVRIRLEKYNFFFSIEQISLFLLI